MTTDVDDVPAEESSQMSRRQGWLLVGALVLLSLFLFFVDFSPRQAEPRQIESGAGFEPILVLSDVEMTFAPALGEETAVFVGTLTPGSNHNLTAIDLTSGELKWEVSGSEQFHPYFWPEEWPWQWPFSWDWGPVVALNNQVFVGDSFLLTTSLNSFNFATGEPGWQRAIGNINGSSIGYLAAIEEEIALGIDVEGYSEFNMLEAELGFRQMRRMEDAGKIFWAETEPERIYEAFANQIRVTGENSWQRAFPGCDAQPVIHQEMVVVKTNRCGEGELSGDPGIFALSRANGALLWQIDEEIVSNLAVDGDRAVGLTANATLLVLDAARGLIVGQLPFSALEMNLEPDFFVAAGGDVTAVYFGDSQELIVLRDQTG